MMEALRKDNAKGFVPIQVDHISAVKTPEADPYAGAAGEVAAPDQTEQKFRTQYIFN
jgi:hypothetical protein